MKAVVYNQSGSPEVLHTIEMEKPTSKRNEILIKIGGSGLNPVDTYFRKGIRQVSGFPAVPHFDLSGTVEEIGADVSRFQAGDRVWATNVTGTCAEYVTAAEKSAFPLPENTSFVEGAALAMPFMTAHLSLFYRGNVRVGETVLIYGGAGAVGNAAVQLAKIAGATVIATAGGEEKARLCHKAGADHILLYKQVNVMDEVLSLTAGTGVDLILDMSLSENLERDLQMITVGGRIIAIGSPKNNTPTLPWRLLNQKHAAIMGVLLFTAPGEILRKAGEEISALLEQQAIFAHVGAVFPFAKAAEAHEALENHTVNGSIVLTP
ncbi:NADPH2:quinone reductase [Evansella caseinilytica]|uniref:NADPH2:quinone reductase n=1 Tax=Evansella caseinilytica TaxID=1503961 RepID=A0A1H3J2S3_9BACI|nr:NADPH:quinone reductase [Evansella caseinilytica]SDY34231.1 NADPH2:quinone reductase [Evansella caseinilytica]